MSRRPILIAGGVVILVIIGAVTWYLASPLFINRTVDEAFPFELPDAEQMAQMSESEIEQLRVDFESAIPDATAMAQMSGDERQAVEDKAMTAAAAMPTRTMDDAMPDEPILLVQGQFAGADSFHQGSGDARIFELPDGSQIVRLEDFEVINGPDLHVILSTNPTPTTGDTGSYIDLGGLKGNIGSQNYDIPAETDLSQYHSVVIYCLPFHVVFASATLS